MKLLDWFFKGINKKQAVSWSLFDFANSSYSLIIITFIFPIYFKEVIAAGPMADFYWGLITSISILAGGLAAPIIGAMADIDKKRKQKFMFFTIMAVIGTACLYFTGSGLLLIAALIFIITNFFFELTTVMYDSFLPQISSNETIGRISGLGWGLGYLGGVLAMLLFKPLYVSGHTGASEHLFTLTFPATAVFFLLFAIPAFLFIREDKGRHKKMPGITLIKTGIQITLSTLRDIRSHKAIAWFLLAFYFVNDALVTLFAFVSLYARQTLEISVAEIGLIILLVQLIGVPSAIFFGWLSDKKGSKKILLITIGIWCFIIIILTFAITTWMFYVAAILSGMVVGSSQAIARSWLGKLIPEKKRSEFFGFNGFASKVSATTGPLLFGTVSSLTGNQRYAMICLLPFFLISLIIFSNIHEPKM